MCMCVGRFFGWRWRSSKVAKGSERKENSWYFLFLVSMMNGIFEVMVVVVWWCL